MCVCVEQQVRTRRLKPASNSWTGLCNALMFFWVKTRYILDKQMVYPGVSRVFTPLGSRAVREGRVQASFYLNRERKKCISIALFKLIFLRLRRRPRPLMLHRRTSAPLLRVRSCIFDKHRTSQMFTKNVCRRVFGALTKSLEI